MAAQQPIEISAIIFGRLAELWRKDYAENSVVKLAKPTREKYSVRRPYSAAVEGRGDYTVVQLKRQEELKQAIQGRRAKATAENPEKEKQKLAIVEAA